ncbi:MAG: 50S ribosomal protein L13 [Nanoarchaeota archaeon]|nr:50S ribosomal protein L13 [Nanoarchaeota archaeon]
MTEHLIIDAENLIVGRMASFAAKKSLEGYTVDIVNVEKALITGSKMFIMKKLRERRHRTEPRWGPFFHRKEDRFVRRMIRGMLNYKQSRGREAYERILCHIGVPAQFQGKPMEKLPHMSIAKLKNLRFMDIKTICQLMGSKTFKMPGVK